MDSPALFVRRTLWGGLILGCAACGALAAGGLVGWATGVAVGAGVALGNFWMLAWAVLRMGATEGGRPAPRRAGGLRAALQGAVLRLILAGGALALALLFLPVHPLGVALGLVGVHAGMAVLWVATPALRADES